MENARLDDMANLFEGIPNKEEETKVAYRYYDIIKREFGKLSKNKSLN